MKKLTFKGGIHPLKDIHEGKLPTKNKAVEAFTAEKVIIPTNMHIGAPSQPCVKKGDRVLLGQVIAEPVGALGIPVHASVSGIVKDISEKQILGKFPSTCITIENDMQDEWVELAPLGEISSVSADAIIPAIKAAGICGMGGASFPTHFKLTIPEGKSVDTIILNGAECETFLTADYRLMLESSDAVVQGLRAAMKAMGVQKGIIAVEDNKIDAYHLLTQAATGNDVQVILLKTKYPQGGEKQLIKAVTGREVPSGGLPADAGVVVLNVGTAVAIYEAVVLGKPLIERITTVTGEVAEPSNLKIRIGTLVSDVIERCGSYKSEAGKIVFGGTMTGICLPDDNIPVLKGNNGIVVLNKVDAEAQEQSACIRCGKCLDACPIHLSPYKLQYLCDSNQLEEAVNNNLMDCILCGSCSYVCPAKRYLCSSFKNAKEIIAARRKAK